MSLNKVSIPYDVYESEKEMVVIIPLAWVHKEDLHITLTQYELTVSGTRTTPKLKESLSIVQEECYRWAFSQTIILPQGVFFEKIHSQFGVDNILTIIIPKLQIPERITVTIS